MKEHYCHSLLVETPHRKTESIEQIHSSDDPLASKQRTFSSSRQITGSIVGSILRGGVIISAGIILFGLLLLFGHMGGLASLAIYQTFPRTLAQVWAGLRALQPQAVIALGLLLLISTPVVSVSASIIGFALEHDRRYVVIALIVLATLLTSFLVGKGI